MDNTLPVSRETLDFMGMNFMKGYLTYTLAGIMVLLGVLGFATGMIEQDTALTMIWSGLAVFGLRRAIK